MWGLNMSTGEWIIFMNAGDIFYDDKVISIAFENVVNKDNNIKLVFGKTQNVYSNGMKAFKNYSSSNKYDLPFCICHQSAFFESTFIKANHYDLSYKVCADANLLNEIFYKDTILDMCHIQFLFMKHRKECLVGIY